MSDVGWLFVAFAVVWVVIAGYLVTIAARQKQLDQRLRDLEDR
jgi:CcmD family protein